MRISDWSSDVCSSDLIRVSAVYDTEETKSTGVMNRLIAEKNNPQCDVFWSGDPVRNGVLLSKGITEPYQSKQTLLIPEHFREKDNHWIGFSARARVLIYNKNLIASDSLQIGREACRERVGHSG